jgi:carbonic anhydrase
MKTQAIKMQINAPPNAKSNCLFANLKYDVPEGVTVFLISIPVSLGIALASGAPLFSGLIAGIIGGIIIAPLSGSSLEIIGPTAGLAIIVLSAVQQLVFNAFLLALVMVGIIQISMSLAKLGVVTFHR